MTILLATRNPAKQAALRRVLDGLRVTAVTPDEIGMGELAPPEDGPTHLDNAVSKAAAYTRAADLTTVASDGGLEIPALGDAWDGLRTRRFAGPGDDDRIAALLEMLKGVPRASTKRWP